MAPGLNKSGRSHRLSTGQVARRLSVTPDTVLKWIKSGRLHALRTAGGHYRIAEDDLDSMVGADSAQPPASGGGFLHCWEYYGDGGEPRAGCTTCLVYRARASRCYEMSGLAREDGYSGIYCTNSCDSCDYYQQVVRRPRRVLIVTESTELQRRLERSLADTTLALAFAGSEYECSAACDAFRPEYVVIDGSLPKRERSSLCSHLKDDPRIPGVQIILAVSRSESAATEGSAGRALPRAFRLSDLESYITGLEVGPSATA